MKWLPRSYWETQKEWFGKKGISWHVLACITKVEKDETEFHVFTVLCAQIRFSIFSMLWVFIYIYLFFFSAQVQTFILIFEKCNQDWFAVCSVLEWLVHQLVQIPPNLKDIFLRSDNASCYHNAALIINAPAIATKGGLTSKNYSFGKANSGKHMCDRKIAPLKAHVTRYLDEGNYFLQSCSTIRQVHKLSTFFTKIEFEISSAWLVGLFQVQIGVSLSCRKQNG